MAGYWGREEIAKALDVSRAGLSHYIRKYGLPVYLRNRHGHCNQLYINDKMITVWQLARAKEYRERKRRRRSRLKQSQEPQSSE